MYPVYTKLLHVAGLNLGHCGHTSWMKDVNAFDLISDVCLGTFLDGLHNEVLTRVSLENYWNVLEKYCTVLCEDS